MFRQIWREQWSVIRGWSCDGTRWYRLSFYKMRFRNFYGWPVSHTGYRVSTKRMGVSSFPSAAVTREIFTTNIASKKHWYPKKTVDRRCQGISSPNTTVFKDITRVSALPAHLRSSRATSQRLRHQRLPSVFLSSSVSDNVSAVGESRVHRQWVGGISAHRWRDVRECKYKLYFSHSSNRVMDILTNPQKACFMYISVAHFRYSLFLTVHF